MKSKNKFWSDDNSLFTVAKKELFTAVVGDIMDQLGAQHQFLPPEIRPLRDDMVVIGRAMTVLEADVWQEGTVKRKNALLSKPFGMMLRALDDLKPNEVYFCTGASPSYALWGELMSTRAIHCGAAGAVVNGYSRDTRGNLALNFPVFSCGPYAQDQAPRGKVIDFRVPLRIGNVHIESGDILFGDVDGVCVVPRALEEEVFVRALLKARGERRVQKAIARGLSAQSAFDRYGIM